MDAAFKHLTLEEVRELKHEELSEKGFSKKSIGKYAWNHSDWKIEDFLGDYEFELWLKAKFAKKELQ